MKLRCEILYPWALACEQSLQNPFCLFAERLLRALLGQLRLKLRRHNREQLSVIRGKGQVQVRFAEDQGILLGSELNGLRKWAS